MPFRIIKSTIVLLLTLTTNLSSLSEGTINSNDKNVKLIQWSAGSCDNTFDPYRLKNRITNVEMNNNITSITVNFSDNCCVVFKPEIIYEDNKLTLLPYQKYPEELCSCNCCFSIRFEITGLNERNYEVFFQGEKVEVSDEYYETIEPTFEIYKSEKINKTNKYGFKEGLWLSFYDDGKEKDIRQYPETSTYYESSPLWSKKYYASGKLSFYRRSDTSESWFEDGELKSQFIKYQIGDTTYDIGFNKFDNKNLEKKYKKRSYPKVFNSDFDQEYQSPGTFSETIYNEEYYENGQTKSLFGTDTSYFWYKTGQPELKTYNNGRVKYDEQGHVGFRAYYWKERGAVSWGDLSNSLYVYFYQNGDVKEIELVRDEVHDNGKSIYPGMRYSWKWDHENKLTESPKKWKEKLPWIRFNEIKLPSKINKRN